MSAVSHLVRICTLCGHEDVVGVGFVSGTSAPCEHCRNGTATVFEHFQEDPPIGTIFEDNGAVIVGKPCADHKEPILPNWLDLPLGYCFCGQVDDFNSKKPS